MLLQNITRNNQYPYRRCGATATNTETGYMSSQHGLGGPRQFARFTAFGEGAGFPAGYNPGIFMPLKHSWASSSQGVRIAIDAVAAGLLGMPSGGNVALEITTENTQVLPLDTTSPVRTGLTNIEITASASGELKVSGGGSTSLGMSASADCIGILSAEGSSNILVSVSPATLGAIADIVGETTLIVTAANTQILPLDDSPPARTGLVSISLSGSLVPYAIGHMLGSALPYAELSPQSLANAVWQSPATENNTPGTMGSKVNTASSGGVDLDALAQAVWEYEP